MKTYPNVCLVPIYDPDKHTISLHAMIAVGNLATGLDMPKTVDIQKGTPLRVIDTKVPCPSKDVAWIRSFAPYLEILPEDIERMKLNRELTRRGAR